MMAIRSEPDGAAFGVPSLVTSSRPGKHAGIHGTVNHNVRVFRMIPRLFIRIKA
jgi:hypothetical protein